MLYYSVLSPYWALTEPLLSFLLTLPRVWPDELRFVIFVTAFCILKCLESWRHFIWLRLLYHSALSDWDDPSELRRWRKPLGKQLLHGLLVGSGWEGSEQRCFVWSRMVNHSRLGRTLKETYKRQTKHKVQTWRVPCFVSSFLGSVCGTASWRWIARRP